MNEAIKPLSWSEFFKETRPHVPDPPGIKQLEEDYEERKPKSTYDQIKFDERFGLDGNMRLAAFEFLAKDTLHIVGKKIDEMIERVLRGKEWLERKNPKWFELINPNTLAMGNCQDCVLAQVFKTDYSRIVELHKLPTLDEATALGFHPGAVAANTDPVNRTLNILWLTVVKGLRLSHVAK